MIVIQITVVLLALISVGLTIFALNAFIKGFMSGYNSYAAQKVIGCELDIQTPKKKGGQ